MELLNMELLPIGGADYLQRRLPMELLCMELLSMGLLLRKLNTYSYYIYLLADYP